MKRPLGRRRRDRRKEGRKERQAGRSLRGHFVQWKRPLALFALRRSSVRLRTLSDRTDHPAIRLRVEVTACSSVLRLLDRSKYTLSSCRPPRWKILGTLLSSLVRIVDLNNDIRAIAMGFLSHDYLLHRIPFLMFGCLAARHSSQVPSLEGTKKFGPMPSEATNAMPT